MTSSSLSSPIPFPQPNPHPHCSTSTFVSRCPELDLSVTLSHSGTPVKNTPVMKSDQLGVKPSTSGKTGRNKKTKTQVYFASPVATQEPDLTSNTLSHQPIGTQRKNRNHHRGPRQYVAPPAKATDRNLEEMRLNSTLAVKKKLQLLQGTEFNSQKAIKETLHKSERTKILMNTRASDAVNVSQSQLLYNSLVNMDVQKDELSQAVQERLLLAPTSSCQSNKERGGPSHLIFMTSDLMRQQPFSSEEGTAKSKLCPLPPSSRSAFDLYRRQKCHEATS